LASARNGKFVKLLGTTDLDSENRFKSSEGNQKMLKEWSIEWDAFRHIYS